MAPREVDGCAKLRKRAGAEVRNFSVWPLGPQPAERGVFGHNEGVACGARETVTNPARPMAPRFPGPLGHPPRPSPSLVQVWRHFATFFLARWGVPAPKGQNKGFPRSGRILGGMGPERCGSGVPNGPFGWPHSRFGRARYLNSDPQCSPDNHTARQGRPLGSY